MKKNNLLKIILTASSILISGVLISPSNSMELDRVKKSGGWSKIEEEFVYCNKKQKIICEGNGEERKGCYFLFDNKEKIFYGALIDDEGNEFIVNGISYLKNEKSGSKK